MSLPKDFRWKQVGVLGSGGQATVLEVEDSTGALPGRYALKPLRKNASTKAYERFYREIKAINALSHPSVVKVLESSSPDAKFHYYVMELIPGARTLKKLLNTQNNPFTDNAASSLRVFEELVGVIAAANDAGIVHRDLSPSNVLITPEGSIKVIDFGICQIEGETRITLVDEGVGTINYMAPECESGASGKVSFRSDLYSAGKILWSAVTNRFAFAREASAFKEKALPNVSNNVQTWHLHHVFEKTIRHNPDHRFESLKEAYRICDLVRGAITLGCLPLEVLPARCPVCYVGEILSPPGWPAQANHPFRNPLPDGHMPVQCNSCGFWQALARDKLYETLRNRTTLQ